MSAALFIRSGGQPDYPESSLSFEKALSHCLQSQGTMDVKATSCKLKYTKAPPNTDRVQFWGLFSTDESGRR